jgi:arsenate reductase-like glutaredoxin family protein
MVVYGLKTCDTVRKALAALSGAGHAAQLRDVRAEPLAPAEWAWLASAFGERLVNRASTTWRSLGPETRALPVTELLARHPAAMKRPVIVRDGQLWLGWGKEVQAAVLQDKAA